MFYVMVLQQQGKLIGCEGGSLSVYIRLGSLYWEMSSCKHWDKE